MRFASWQPVILACVVGGLVACGPPRPRLYGDTSVLAPQVAGVKGEKTPQHLNVSLAQPANVSVFLVIPGRTPTLLFPKDSTQSPYLEPGIHEVATTLEGRKSPLADSSGMQRRPRIPGEGRGEQPGRQPDSTMYYGTFREVGYLLVFASQNPIPYASLRSRVAAYTIPGTEAEGLSAVTKLLRDAAGGSSPWAAYAIEYQP